MSQRPSVYQDEGLWKLQTFIEMALSEAKHPRVLDVGCGQALPVDFSREVWLVGLDISPEALSHNRNIDEAILGDVESDPLPAEDYHVVVCWWVLEHLRNPHAAIKNMARCLKPGGVLIIGVPVLWSFKGLLTKLTPHWFHVWTYRHVFRVASAGLPGQGPYRTYLRPDIAPTRLAQVARLEGLERVHALTYRPNTGFPRALQAMSSGLAFLGRAATLGRWDPEASEHVAVFRRT